jgi:two-component system cell cycle sensor histidine kinase/response regulator CckA
MGNTRILVVEDEVIVLRDLQQTLAQLGYDVPAVATSGAAAIAQAAAVRPDLVLMDIRLRGEMDGITAAQQIRTQFAIPVVYVTAHADALTLQRVQPTTPYGYVLKPFNERELYVAVETALYRHTVEGKLKRMEQWLATTLKSIGDAVIATDHAGMITFMNPIAEALTGWTQADALGRPLTEVFVARVEPTQIPIENPVVRVLQEGIVIDLEPNTYLVARDGRTIAISDSAAPIRDDHGTITGVVLVFRDVTEHKRTEQALRGSEGRYRLLAEHSRDLIGLLDHRSQVLYASPSHESVLGMSPDDLLDQSIFTLIHPDDRAQVQTALNNLGHVGTSATIELRLHTTSGSWIVVEAILASIMDAVTGEPQLLFSARDITERKRLETQLLQAQKLESIGQLAGGVAHDFNNLLTVITGHADLALGMAAPNDPTRSDLEELRKAADRAAGLTRQLLAFARKQILEPRVLTLNDLVLEMDKLLRRLIGEDIELITLPAPDLGRVRVDPGQIEQVLINLVVNARDAMPEGGKLTIETQNVVLDDAYAQLRVGVIVGSYVMLAVSDTGIGMDQATQQHIFDPFFTTKAIGRGTGLGLATCYGIVKQHTGNIWVYSEVGQGTTFKIYLPRVGEAAELAVQPDGSQEMPRGTEVVLLVEDEPAVRNLVARVLRTQGYTLLEAGTGGEALQVIQTHPAVIDLLVTDVVMPEMSGKALADHMARRYPRIRVLFISGYTDRAIVHHGRLEPDVIFLQKPFTPLALAQKVRAVLDS